MFWWEFVVQGKYFKEECWRPSDEGDRCILFGDVGVRCAVGLEFIGFY